MNDVSLDHLRLLDDATTRFATLVGEATLDEPVGTIHRWAASIVLSGQRVADPQPLVVSPLADWYAGTAAALLAALRAVDPSEPVPNFSRVDQTAAFWPRRQLHEVTVHVVDLLQALGRDESQWAVPAELAADGVDEVLRVFFPRMVAKGSRPEVRSRIRLVADDVDRSWVVAPADGDAAPAVRADPGAEADAVVSGKACDLYLALWHRVPRERLRFEGDDAIALLDGPTTP
jgi:uncharacterized protein (TIGR03083 family)